MTFRILITARNPWQALDWLATTTGRSDFTLNVSHRIITLGRNIEARIFTTDEFEDYRKYLGCEFDLIIFLQDCPHPVREFLLTRWRP